MTRVILTLPEHEIERLLTILDSAVVSCDTDEVEFYKEIQNRITEQYLHTKTLQKAIK